MNELSIVKPFGSDYARPIDLFKKRGNFMRLCLHYRKLNITIVKDNYPFPLSDDVLDQLQNPQVFTLIDLLNGFFPCDVDPNSNKCIRHS